MLKGIPKCISPDLLKALADMGHGDLVVIADDFYPAVSMARNGITINADGIGAAEMLDAILTLMPLDTEYEKHPVQIMDVMEESCVGFIDRFSFYDKAKTSFVTISTGERQPYGCVLLQKGVM